MNRNKKNTILIYKRNGNRCSHVFSGMVSYATIEAYLIMNAHIGRSAVPAAIVGITNLL